MTALVLYVQVALCLAVARLGWLLLRLGVLERSPGPAAPTSSRLAHAVLVLALLAPALVRCVPSAPSSAAPDGSAPAVGREVDAVDAPGFTLLGGAVDAAATPGVIRGVAALVVLAMMPWVVIAALRTASQWTWLRGVTRRAERLRRLGRVEILASPEVTTPFSTVVLGRAHVVVPASLVEDRPDLSLVLRHELHHHRRRDVHWALALDGLRVLFAWHPAMHAWARELSDWQERACDAELLARGVPVGAYAACLLHVAEASLGSPVPVASAAMARPNGRAALRRRMEMLLDTENRTRRLGPAGKALLAGLGAVLATSAWATTVAFPPAVTSTVAAAAATAAQAPPVPASLQRSLPAGTPAPDFELADGRTERTSLRDLRGRVVVIDFWAEWCRYCSQAVPALRALEEELADGELAIVGVSLDGTRAAFDRFVDAHDLTWPQHHAAGGWQGRVARDYQVRALPLHVVIDRRGRIAASGVRLEELRPVIEDLLER